MNALPQPAQPADAGLQQTSSEPKRRVFGRPFQPGQSGNPTGRRRGSVSLRSAIKRALTQADADAIARALIQNAKDGGVQSTKLLLDHLPDPPDDPIARLLGHW